MYYYKNKKLNYTKIVWHVKREYSYSFCVYIIYTRVYKMTVEKKPEYWYFKFKNKTNLKIKKIEMFVFF